ncbi:uncharacterized protein LOC117295137 [Asterias rubens]|uniref:uncharacterized protein LOC117295137 n=1 Tax=Asterias rubens TaxID=7604 RepID=UPI00145573EB|nr:uncharacterized protein LOC117295137 [Asterias rubens]
MRPEMILKKKAQDTWIAVVALLCVYYGLEVAARDCYLGQEPDSNQEGKLRWVLPVDYNNRCICTQLLPGGLILYTPERSYIPYYIDQPPFRATEKDLVLLLDCPVDFSIIGKPTEQSSTYRAEAS